MRAVDRARAAGRMWRGGWTRAVAPTALVACALGSFGCAERCRADDPARDLALQAASQGDAEAMRRLIAQDPGLANARQCAPDATIGRLMAWRTSGGTPSVLHVAARQGHDALVGQLLAAGAAVDAPDADGTTPLHVAAQYGHDEVVRVLLEAGATIDSRRIGRSTSLHLAASHGRFPVVKRLLAAGADPNSREDGDWTPLHRAASDGHESVVRLLLAHGADPRAIDDQGATPFQYAFLYRHVPVAELLAARDPGFSTSNSARAALARAAGDGDAEGVRFLLSKGVDVNSTDRDGLTPLQLAINQWPSPRADRQDPRAIDQRKVVELLLTAGAQVEARGRNGARPLHHAAKFGRVDIAELLLARGAQVDARDEWDWTPLDWAASRGEAAMVEMLLAHGAEVRAKNKARHTPRDESSGNERINALLESYAAK